MLRQSSAFVLLLLQHCAFCSPYNCSYCDGIFFAFLFLDEIEAKKLVGLSLSIFFLDGSGRLWLVLSWTKVGTDGAILGADGGASVPVDCITFKCPHRLVSYWKYVII